MLWQSDWAGSAVTGGFMDNEEKKKYVKSIEVIGDEVQLVVMFPKSEFINPNALVDYGIKREVEQRLVQMLANVIFEENKKEIVQEVLKDVNWAEIVRSEIAQRVIEEAAKGRRPGY